MAAGTIRQYLTAVFLALGMLFSPLPNLSGPTNLEAAASEAPNIIDGPRFDKLNSTCSRFYREFSEQQGHAAFAASRDGRWCGAAWEHKNEKDAREHALSFCRPNSNTCGIIAVMAPTSTSNTTSAPVATAFESSLPAVEDATSTWRGTYSCNGTQIIATIYFLEMEWRSDVVVGRGLYDFRDSAGRFEGRYEISVQVNVERRGFQLNQRRWLVQPDGTIMASISGSFASDFQSFEGNVIAGGCGNIRAEQIAGGFPPAQPKPEVVAETTVSEEGLRLVNDMVRRTNSIRRFCTLVSEAGLDGDDRALGWLREAGIAYDLELARDAWRFHPNRLRHFQETGNRSLAEMSIEERGAVGRRVLECLASGAQRSDAYLQQFFLGDFAAQQYAMLFHPQEMRPVLVSDSEIGESIRPEIIAGSAAVERHETFAREAHQALHDWAGTQERAVIERFFARWAGRLETADPWLAMSLARMVLDVEQRWRVAYMHDIRRSFDLGRFDLERFALSEPFPDVGQADLRWLGRSPFEMIIGSHFGMRHYVTASSACAQPAIRTEALAMPKSAHLVDAYYAVVKAYRQACGKGERNAYSVNVALEVGGAIAATFLFHVGGDLHDGQLGRASNLEIVNQPEIYDPVAQWFWTYPRSHTPLEGVADALLEVASPALRGDIHYALATQRDDNGTADIVTYSAHGGDIFDGRLSNSFVAIDVVDPDQLELAAIEGVPAAVMAVIDAQLNADRQHWGMRPNESLSDETIADYTTYLRALFQENFFHVFHGIEMAREQGFDIREAVLTGEGKIGVFAVPPSSLEAYLAINAHILNGACSPLGYLFNPESEIARTGILAVALWERYNNGCQIRGGGPGNRVFFRPAAVEALSCQGGDERYFCDVRLLMDCGVETPTADGLPLPALPQLAEITEGQICSALKGSVELQTTRWRFDRTGSGDWAAQPQE